MKNKLIIILGIVVISMVLFLGFQNSFYNYYQDGDIYRLPLIKPYELISDIHNKRTSWNIPNGESRLLFDGMLSGSPHVDSVGIKNEIILLYSDGEFLPDKAGRYPLWFVYDTKNRQGKYFMYYDQFNHYLKSKGINAFSFYDPSLIFYEFKSKGTLPTEWNR